MLGDRLGVDERGVSTTSSPAGSRLPSLRYQPPKEEVIPLKWVFFFHVILICYSSMFLCLGAHLGQYFFFKQKVNNK